VLVNPLSNAGKMKPDNQTTYLLLTDETLKFDVADPIREWLWSDFEI